MACRCKECGWPTACNEEYCYRCLIDRLKTPEEKRLATGGRFYGEKLEKEINNE